MNRLLSLLAFIGAVLTPQLSNAGDKIEDGSSMMMMFTAILFAIYDASDEIEKLREKGRN